MARHRSVRNKARFVGLVLGCFPGIAPAVGQTFTSSNLPIVVIDVGRVIPDEPKVDAWMHIIDRHDGLANRLTDASTGYDGRIGIEVRGSSSQSFPKKSYAVETRDAAGNDLSVSLVGLPDEADWILYGPYSDKTFMRNALIMHLSNAIGRYASRTRFVELVLDGTYAGVYVLMERIERDADRVDIARLAPDDTTGDDLTGGYILKIDKPEGAEVGGWYSDVAPHPGSPDRVRYQYHYPRPSAIAPSQAAFIRQAVAQFEAVMSGPTYDDPEQGYARYLDVDSAVDFILLNELPKNIDGYRLSTFFHRDRDRAGEPPARFVLGPIWDFNLGFGNADYYGGGNSAGFQVEYRIPDGDYQPPFWFGKLWEEPGFAVRVRSRWTELRSGPFSRDSIMAFIDRTVEQLREAEARDAERWGNLGRYVWPNPIVWQTWDEEINYLKTWIDNRLVWVDGRLLSGVDSEQDTGSVPSGDLRLDVFPNPAVTRATVEVRAPGGLPVRIDVIDVLGRCVAHETTGPSGGGPVRVAIDAAGLPPGSYRVRVLSGDRVVSGSMVVAR